MDSKEKDFRASLHKYLVNSGEKDRLLNFAQKKLYETNWREKVILDCNEIMMKVGIENVDPDILFQMVQTKARSHVDEHIKKQIIDEIYKVLEDKCKRNLKNNEI